MDQLAIFKALSNKTRLDILQWLKDPERHFPPQEHADFMEVGVCVGKIQEKCGMTQSTVSEYLALLLKAGLLEATRIGQWTYYKRNEKAFELLGDFVKSAL
ncbi:MULTISPECIES: ArsR/SmtB family transcription factor [Olivibacter]|uniref:ArsR/SmtB family transcription factor n=1 Tax=Olivibacter oleidegradans TaxID=760123 RepID=A0ABV6HLQ8_9SPHI|nr:MULTISPECIES: helix-turn-helix transcriptional regulator [Olivibacter]MDM8175859.1 helix-turn-helix transcriptional regulator [Olivibacter sp. 47]QEL02584.1 helix-turn-helix transcriptional regulator [Olivibacter sp. LS-1]